MVSIETRLTSAGVADKKEFVLKSLYDIIGSFTVEERSLLALVTGAVKQKEVDIFITYLTNLVQSLAERAIITLDKWIFDISSYSSTKTVVNRNLRKLVAALFQACLVVLLTWLTGGTM
mgnify:FL=1